MKIPLLLAAVFAAGVACAETPPPIPLWSGQPPGALGNDDKDIPTLTPFLPQPDKATGAAMIVCPGGGYGGLAPHEGREFALWLVDNGIAAFVLKYRLGSAGYRHPVPLQDAARAVRLVRARAGEWNLDTNRVGIIGSSAGGHLASTLLTRFDGGDAAAGDAIERQSSRPDLGILCYPVITMGEKTHAGSRNNLLGPDPAPELIDQLSNHLRVTPGTPPCFLLHTAEDKGVPAWNSLLFAQALARAGVPYALHIYEKGPHGLGLGVRQYDPGKLHPWTKECLHWLKLRGFVN